MIKRCVQSLRTIMPNRLVERHSDLDRQTVAACAKPHLSFRSARTTFGRTVRHDHGFRSAAPSFQTFFSPLGSQIRRWISGHRSLTIQCSLSVYISGAYLLEQWRWALVSSGQMPLGIHPLAAQKSHRVAPTVTPRLFRIALYPWANPSITTALPTQNTRRP